MSIDNDMKLFAREMEQDEAGLVVEYFLNLDKEQLDVLGIDPDKLPGFEEWLEIINDDIVRQVMNRRFFFIIWEVDGIPVGHSNINDIVYGKNACMHLHMWSPGLRQRGYGTQLITDSISTYFDKFSLEVLYCQPNVHNLAPNKTLAKIGFELLETIETIPGWINIYQTINRWALTRERFEYLDQYQK